MLNANDKRTRSRWWVWAWVTHGANEFPQNHHVTYVLMCQVIILSHCPQLQNSSVYCSARRFSGRSERLGIAAAPTRLAQLRLCGGGRRGRVHGALNPFTDQVRCAEQRVSVEMGVAGCRLRL